MRRSDIRVDSKAQADNNPFSALGVPYDADNPFSPAPFLITTIDEVIEAARQLRRLGFDVAPMSGPRRKAGRPRSHTAASDRALKEMAAALIVENPNAKLEFIAFAIASRLDMKRDTVARYLTRALKGTGFRLFRQTVLRKQKVVAEVF